MMTVGKKVVRAIKALGLTQEEGAEILGVSRGSVASYSARTNANPSKDKVDRLIEYSRKRGKSIPENWFYDGEDTPPPMGQSAQGQSPGSRGGGPSPGFNPPAPFSDRESHPKVGRRVFPVLGNIGAAEFPIEPGEHDDFVEFSDDLYTDAASRYAVRIIGDSMEPTWEHGDYALIHPDPSCRTSSLYVACGYEGGHLIKILLRGADTNLYLVPENPNFLPIRLDTDGWSMVGYVVGFRRELGKYKYKEWGDDGGLTPDKHVLVEAKTRLAEWIKSQG